MTCKMDRNALLRMIDSAGLEEAQRSVLRKTVAELCAYQEQQLERMEKKILSPENPHSFGEIVVALAPKDTCCPSLTKIAGTANGVCFLEAGYVDFLGYIGEWDTEKVYTGSYRLGERKESFQYQLKFDNSGLQAQELLCRLVQLYPAKNAILWGPYLRKAVRIRPMSIVPEKAVEVDPRFAANGLPVVENADLLWNLQVENLEGCKAVGKIPYGENVKYVFHFDKSKNGGWRFPLPEESSVIVYDVSFSDEGIDLTLDRDLLDFTVVEQQDVDWEQKDIIQLMREHRIHSNHVEKTALSVRRILSRGDMEFAIRPFREVNGGQCALVNELERTCTRYSNKFLHPMKNRIYYPQSQHRKPIGKLKFSTETPPVFYDDYINYVLLYLEYYYPEIEWIGGW